jgi:hypothetical protein
VVIFHDTHEYQEGFGVHRFWEEIASTAPSFEFHHGHGLGVLAPGREVPAKVREFLAAANADPDGVRAAYAEFGRLVAGYAELGSLRHDVQSLHATVASLRDHTSNLNDVLDGVYASSSWRLTAPLRRLKDIASVGARGRAS